VDWTRTGGWAGVASAVLTQAAVLAATVASPGFRWTGNALSDLGNPGHRIATPVTTLLFDGGLILGGLLGTPFGYLLWTGGDHWVERAAALPFVPAMLAMAGIGLFPSPQPLHAPVAIAFYLLSMVTMGVYGAGNALAGARVRGLLTLGLVAVHVGVWYWWASGGPVLRDGLAVPEAIGAVVVAGWVVATAHWHLTGRRAATARADSGVTP